MFIKTTIPSRDIKTGTLMQVQGSTQPIFEEVENVNFPEGALVGFVKLTNERTARMVNLELGRAVVLEVRS